uniref:RING-type domain-containing protein n=1 Tax=Globodera pallida TaxID=36090 RepID=A0A183C0L4_GLOPA
MFGALPLKQIVHDAKGCERKCWYYSKANKQLIVAGREMVYFYDINDCLEMGGENGRCHALGRGSDKVQLLEKDGQIALIAEQETHIQSNNSKMNTLYLFDIELRYIAFFCSMPSPSRIFTLAGEIYLLNSEGILSKLVEETLRAGVNPTFSRKGDFDNAIKQYVNTFGFVEPSNIIKKFLDGARISQLCHYLEALHAEDLAIGQHTTLLISAYVKLHEPQNVDLKKLTKTLANKPRRTEELFGELNLAGELKDPQVRCILFEQRLKSLQESGISPSKAQFEEIVSLLDSDTIERSLLKAYQYNCSPVVVHILRLLNRTEELFRYLLSEGDVVGAIELCESKSLQDMWVELISFGTTSKSATRKEDLFALLRKISESNSLNPLIVLEILSRDESLQVGDIRDIVIGWLERQDKSLRENEREIAEQERQLFEMNKEIEDLENKLVQLHSFSSQSLHSVQVYQVAKCTVCNNHLQVPAIHFLCRHSYHANCFESYSGNRPDECPACAASERKLAESTDVMAFISECLANGQFGTSQQNSGPRKEMPFNPFDEDETT